MKSSIPVVVFVLTLCCASLALASTDAQSLAGLWQGNFNTPGPSGEMTLDLASATNGWSGHIMLHGTDGKVIETDVRNVKSEGEQITFDASLEGADVAFSGKLATNKLAGTLEAHEGNNTVAGTWELVRQ